jgi:CheY-like chemotaxis protein
VAHDFNNVMTVILGYSAVLLQELSQNSSGRHFVEEIQRAGERCAALTSQLLAFSRKQMLHPVSLDLHRVIRDLMGLLKSLIGEHIAIVLQLDSTPRWVKVDAVQLEQVLLNLTVNARDAMPHGGTLTIDTGQVFPDQAWGPEGPRPARTYVRLRVHDTGAGIDPAAKPKIFEPFFTTKPLGQGTGLGLSTVYGIVHQSGGPITVESAPEQGTTMTVYLPEVPPPRPTLSPAAQPENISRRGTEEILLVEDEPSVRLLTQHILRTHGYTVHEAEDGFQALDLIRRSTLHIDLVVTDLAMPGMNGKELAMRLRSHFGGLKVLYMSGYSENTPLTGEESQGQTGFLQKPFSPEDLIRRVQEILHAGTPA